MVSQMAHAKNLGGPFMAHLENLYNIPCLSLKMGILPCLQIIVQYHYSIQCLKYLKM